MARGFLRVVVFSGLFFLLTTWAVAAEVAWYPLDEGQGQLAYAKQKGIPPLELHQAKWTRGIVGKALEFSGHDSFAKTTTGAGLHPSEQVTLSLWVKVNSLPKNFEGIGLAGAGNSYLLRISSGSVFSFHTFIDGWKPTMAQRALQVGKWYNVVGVYDGKRMYLYVNGELVASTERSGKLNQPPDGLMLARQVNELAGVIDEVRLYDTALKAKEIKRQFEQTLKAAGPEVEVGRLIEPFAKYFGETRDHPAPLPTLRGLPKSDFTFAVITDTHLGTAGEEGIFCHNWRVEELIRQLNALRPDFVMHCGDIITVHPFSRTYEAQCQYALDLFKQLKAPIHFTAGNHDVGNQRNMRVWDDKWLDRVGITLNQILFQLPYREVYEKYFGPDYYSFVYDNNRFIVFDDEICNSGYPLEQEQEEWLAHQLELGAKNAHTFIFSHNPLFWGAPDEPGPANYEPVQQPARQRLLDLLAKTHPTAMYTGHTHFAFGNYYAGVWLRTLNSTTFNRNYPGIEQQMPGSAQIYDPYKLGFLVVRVQGDQYFESWVPLYWRVPDLPAELQSLAGGRLVPCCTYETQGAPFAVVAAPPGVLKIANRWVTFDHFWRAAENLGAGWVRLPSPPSQDPDWSALERALTLGKLHGSKLALPLPQAIEGWPAFWTRLAPYAGQIQAVLVPNGAAADKSMPLASWQPAGTPADWAKACRSARKLTGSKTKVLLFRLPLLGEDALQQLQTAAAALEGKADGLVLWCNGHNAPESALIPALQAAAEVARAHKLELWLDAACWQTVPEPQRSAWFLRLLSVCTAEHVTLCWWPNKTEQAGLFDYHLDPTALYHDVANWWSLADAASGGPEIEQKGARFQVEWQDAEGRTFLAWWQAQPGVKIVEGAAGPTLPEGAVLIDPLHGQLLKVKAGYPAPVATWPLLARLD